MKLKTSELSGAALDWAVAKCEGYTDWCGDTEKLLPPRKEYGWVDLCDLRYSTDWAQGGPIIGRGGISWHCGNKTSWHAYAYGSPTNYNGPTPLIAAMRCYVASRLGDEVEVPEELA